MPPSKPLSKEQALANYQAYKANQLAFKELTGCNGGLHDEKLHALHEVAGIK